MLQFGLFLLGFGPHCLDLGFFGRKDGRMDGRTDSPCVLQPKSKQYGPNLSKNGPNPSIKAQIQAKWSKSGQNLDVGGYNTGVRGQNDGPQASIGVFWLDLGHFA